ncbi:MULTISPECIES: YceI family protein [Robiginitalea]|uniref:YCE I like family protein n=1 Tax=Robiginitalea biformata (strain ATCC BAA-864 / DSM 15991 / KCTC 12146 / HTCC2501) TaxID=313596 RepID=A4CP75_ROBBH|nr:MULTISPECIES: YceI family protein [Robiginitalea]EAR14196.1 YCE I like family protein [Robiginitalea biformata HTCC2501]MDC6354711.1 YceI family protein [Robiginitalea sp. PM2]MDC6374607.1 YceI family protein [Robiginitalea sp. SP8]
MKKNLFALTLAVVTTTATLATEPAADETKTVDAKASTVTWKAYKVTGSHTGTVALKSGSLIFDGDKLTGGEFQVDMTTLTATDLEGEYRDKLVGHLKSDDFFSTEKYNTSKLVFTQVKSTGKNSYEVTGNLTIKGITNPVTFDLSVYGSKATANVKVDRAAYDIRYGSGSFFDNLGDKTIYDEFDLVVDLEFATAS